MICSPMIYAIQWKVPEKPISSHSFEKLLEEKRNLSWIRPMEESEITLLRILKWVSQADEILPSPGPVFLTPRGHKK